MHLVRPPGSAHGHVACMQDCY